MQVGGRDFALDLLFFHRGLNSLVAFELKVGRFEPEYLGKLSFYLEALDRDATLATKLNFVAPLELCSAIIPETMPPRGRCFHLFAIWRLDVSRA